MKALDFITNELEAIMQIDSPTGFTEKAAAYVENRLKEMGFSPERTNKGGILCCLGGKSKDGVLLTAHLDTLGAMVREIKASGRLKITPVGGLNANNIETECCKIYTREGKVLSGTVQLVNPSIHVNGEYNKTLRDFDNVEVVIDERVSDKAGVEALGIEVGNYVCPSPRTVITPSGYIKSRFLDDKLSVAILLGLANEVSKKKHTLSRKTYLHITVFEEVGHGGTASIPPNVSEILGVDMGCVGEGLECDEHQVSICAMDSAGPSNYEMTSKLVALAKENKLNYAVDVYPFYGSDADAAVRAGNDVRHGLIGSGVYASHGYERTHKDGVENTFKLLKAYTK